MDMRGYNELMKMLIELPFKLLFWLIKLLRRYVFISKRQRKFFKYVPKYCQSCDMLHDCRDEENNWKCRHGCQEIKARNEEAEWQSIIDNMPPERSRNPYMN